MLSALAPGEHVLSNLLLNEASPLFAVLKREPGR
jgi:hypothetical protein